MLSAIEELLQPEVQGFLRMHENDDEHGVVLRQKSVCGVTPARLAEQIAARRKAHDKLPLFYEANGIIYPPLLNLEQSSSQAAAEFKTAWFRNFLENVPADTGADITCGFGVDSLFLSRLSRRFICVEPSAALLALARHNHAILGASNIEYVNASAERSGIFAPDAFSFLYIDPSRRNEGEKVYKLAECSPDVTALQAELFRAAPLMMIKAAPLLDLTQATRELSGTACVLVLAVRNEVREVLFVCRRNFSEAPRIECVNLGAAGKIQQFNFSADEENKASSIFSEPLRYLYEPNASILKGGAFKLAGTRFGLSKIQSSTHLYTSAELLSGYPGRTFEVIALDPDYETIREFLPDGRASVLTRNYPQSPEQLKKRLRIADGGSRYVIGFSGVRKKFTAVANRV